MAAPNPPSGGPSANSNGGGASPAPSLISVSSGTSRISFAIPSATPQKAAAKGAPVNLDTRAALPPKPVAANASLAQAATKGTQASKGIPSLGLPPRPETSWPLNAAGSGSGTVIGGLMRMGSAVAGPGPSTSRETREKGEIKRDRSLSREPGEWSPEQDRRRRSRSRDRDRVRERDRRDRDREWERERERDRDREVDRYRRERSRERERERDRRDHRDRERGRDRDHHLREQRDRDRERDRDRGDRYRNDRYRGSVSPEKRSSYDDERSNGHGRGYAPFSRDREHDREHDRRGDRYTGDLSSRSPVKSPERSERLARSPVKRARSLVASSAKRRSPSPPKSASKRAASPPPKGEAKRAPSPPPTSVHRAPSPPPAPPPAAPSEPPPPPAPPSDPPPPPSDDIPPPPPEPAADAPPPPPPASPPPPPPPGPKPDMRLPSRPLSATTSLPTTRPTATPPTGPRALTRAPSYGPSAIKAPTASQPAWGPSAANGSAPAWGPKAVPRGPAAWGPNSVAAAPKAPPQPEWKPPPSASRRPGNGNWLMVPDPSDSKTSVKRMDGVHNGVEARVRDPRLKLAPEVRERGAGYMKHRKDGLHTLKYEWDEHSPGPKPPPPPTAVLLTNLNPLTTVDQVSKFLRPYGRIKEIDAKMDTKSGSQLGIVWVRFDGPALGKTGTAHDVAKNVVKMCDGQRVGMQGGSGGMERVKVVLDGRGLLAEKAVKEEMARRHAPKPKPPAAAATPSAPTPIASTPSEGKQTPKPSLSRPAPRPPPARGGAKFDTLGRNFSSLNRSLPVGRFQQQRQIPRPGFGVQDFSRDFHGPSQQEAVINRRFTRGGDLYSPASRSRSRSRSRSPPSSSESDSDDDFRRERSPSPRRRARGPARAAVEKKEADEAAVERVRKALASNGKAYVFVDAKSLPSITPEHLVRDHFRAFKPDEVLHNHTGWFVLFSDDQAAYRAQRVLDTTAVQGHRINIDVRTPKGEAAGPAEPEKAAGAGGWRLLTISKNRKAPARQPSPQKMRRKLSVSYTSSDEDEAPRRAARKVVEVKAEPELEDKVVPSPVVEESRVEDVTVEPVEPKVEIEVNDEVVEPKRKRAGKDKPTKTKTKKARIGSPPHVAEVKVAAPPKAKAKPRKKTVVDMVVEADLLADDEDAFWLAQALAHGDDGMELSDAETELDDEHPLYHTSGAWRAEGWRKVAATKKSAYLPQRNRATAAASAAAMPGGTAVLATGRTARVEGRRLALDMESTRKAVSSAQHTEANDVFAFNQLRIRKKQLRFARSAIEGYGLYAMEPIHTGEMVCEYVGELCRVAVSEVREQRYMKQGIGSSYLFRIDGDIVCDATFKGSVSRLVNHSCDPNCLAKIISINGVNKIVLYAKRTIHPGEEVLYSYNFALETDPALRVPCLCGSEKCTGFLN